jgi:hypothetical protein
MMFKYLNEFPDNSAPNLLKNVILITVIFEVFDLFQILLAIFIF